jgi:hypothetical protein
MHARQGLNKSSYHLKTINACASLIKTPDTTVDHSGKVTSMASNQLTEGSAVDKTTENLSGYDVNPSLPGTSKSDTTARTLSPTAANLFSHQQLAAMLTNTTVAKPAGSQSQANTPAKADTKLKGQKNVTGKSLYRPLDHTKNEIRLLRILPSTQDPDKQMAHEAASDIITCDLEYESMDDIKKMKQERDDEELFEQNIDTMMMQMMGIGSNQQVYRSPEEAKAQMAKRQAYNQLTGEQKLKLGSKDDYHISVPRLRMLRNEYITSIQTMASWLPDSYRRLMQYTQDFEHWLQNLIWSPLSQHPDYAENIGLGYYALSYMWTDPPFPLHDTNLKFALKLTEAGGLGMKDFVKSPSTLAAKQIVINGQTVPVGENLYEALRSMREIPEVRNGARIWVDSLCIDQSNLKERNEEVKRMGQIYSNADRVISHIGKSENHADEVLQTMEMIGYSIADAKGADRLKEWFHTQTNSPFFHYFSLMMSRGYWSRIWIMQEIALASESSILICGMKRYPLVDLLLFGKWQTRSTIGPSIPNRASPIGRAGLSHSSSGSDPIMTLGNLVDGSAKLKNMYELRQLIEVNKARLECFNTLWFRTAAENRATDPRDMIYGMLALLPSKLVERVQVNYEPANTYQKVMIDFTMSHIRTYDTLHWILFRPHSSFPKYHEWPSWVPNLGLPFNSSRFFWTTGSWVAYSGINDTSEWACNNGNLLHCRGFRCDTIEQVTSPVVEEPTPDATVWTELSEMFNELTKDSSKIDKNLLDKALPLKINLEPSSLYSKDATETVGTPPNKHIESSGKHQYTNWEGLKEAVAACLDQLKLSTPTEEGAMFSIPINVIHTALLFQAISSEDSSGSLFFDAADSAIGSLSNFLRHNENLSLWGAKLADFFPGPCDDEISYLVSGRLPSFARLGQMPPVPDQTSQTAMMFTTKSGYLGVALGDLRPGDEIYILNKCRMPVALRPSKTCPSAFELLGGVFVHGIMQGEAVAEALETSQPIQTVTLC